MSFSFDGLISGIDSSSIIEGLTEINQAQVDRLTINKNEVLQRQSAFKGVESKLLTFRSALTRLAKSQDSVFEARKATSSDESLVEVAAGGGAIPANYTLRVNSVAKAHQIGSLEFGSSSDQITQGTLDIRVGSGDTTTITVDDENNTVSGLVDAINNATEDVTASIINSDGGSRILLTSNETGESNAITITNNLADSSGDAVKPDFTSTAIQEAQNAEIQIGSGAGAITVEYESNQVEGLIENVSINLLNADPDKDISINVTRDTEAAKSAIQSFVDEFNGLMGFIDDQTAYNAETDQAGLLLGNRSVGNIQDEIRNQATSVIPGLDSTLNRLSQIGIEFGDNGKLTLASGKLDKVLSGKEDGINPDDVQKLFALNGETDHAGVRFLFGSTRTATSSTPYQIDITQAAERASVLGTNDLAATTTITSANNELQLSLDGLESDTIRLAEGDYTQEELARHVEEAINSSNSLRGAEVAVSVEGGKLRITSDQYGSASELNSFSGSAIADLGLDGTETNVGIDVIGKFIVDGVEETATGRGQTLIADSENEFTADLQVRVTLTSSQVVSGAEAEINVTRGFGSLIEKTVGEMVDPVDGQLKTVNDSFEEQVTSINDTIDRYNAITEAKREALITQFQQMETLIQQMQTTSSFLSSQLQSLAPASLGG